MLSSLLLAATLATPSADVVVAATDDQTWNLTITVRGLRSDDGKVLAQLFDSSKGFPGDDEYAIDRARSGISGGIARLVWQDLPRGTYAVALMHDENGNGQLDKNFIGIPKEGVGASRNAKARFGPFKWKDAKFEHAGPTKMSVKVKYL